MFTGFFFLLRVRGLKVSLQEWRTLLEGLEKGLHESSLTGFYYLARAVLVHTEADFDRFDQVFLEYFRDVQPFDELPRELEEWLSKPIDPVEYDPAALTNQGLDIETIRKMLEQRMQEQHERHDGGTHWVGTGGASPFGNSGYYPGGIRVGGQGRNRSALQVAGERSFRDFREDTVLETRQFQMAFRRLRQFSALEDGPKTELELDETIKQTGDNAGQLRLVFGRPRRNTVKLLMLFDSGGSMWEFTKLTASLFQAVSKESKFKDLKIYYFHNCFYDDLYTAPGCHHSTAVSTEWVLSQLGQDYKVIVVGDASMAPYELLSPGGCSDYYTYNKEPGIDWIGKFTGRYDRMIWLNPLPQENWEWGYGSDTIRIIKKAVPMYRLTLEGLQQGLKYLTAAR
ncbi:MAG: VWA containing CoxE family protein [Oscillospiraceae bacterium]|nr:VWA containing CoxE family protein [Oscillospiraceae bacterium]